MKIAKETMLFAIGGGTYVLLELLYRGYSHVSMFLAGGLCFLLIGRLERFPMPLAVVLGVGIITAVELITGLLVNQDYSIWDYRDQPGNFLGQICPLFTAIWIPVTIGGLLLYRWADAGLDRIFRQY